MSTMWFTVCHFPHSQSAEFGEAASVQICNTWTLICPEVILRS